MRCAANQQPTSTLPKTPRAPIDGVVTYAAGEGGRVTVIGTMETTTGTQLLTVSDMSTVGGGADGDETDTPTVQVGQKALLNIDAYPARTFRRPVHGGGKTRRSSRTTGPLS